MKLFGTDGLRCPAGQWPLIPESLTRMGYELGSASKGPVIFGRDTRGSGSWILDALSSGVLAANREVWDLGICPTPVVARVTAQQRKGLGVVISASHNPYEDNGIKILKEDGSKAPPSLEVRLEKSLNKKNIFSKMGSAGARHSWARHLVDDDQQQLRERFKSLNLKSLKVAIDTAHGAAWELAPHLLTEFGAQVIQIGASPNGKNINRKCGSMHLNKLKGVVTKNNCDIGFAFDGDADRCLAVSSQGKVLDGDFLLAILANHYKAVYRDKMKLVVGTEMTNGGLETFLKEKKIRLVRTPVGDKYVTARMKKSKSFLGGENSGHLIFASHNYIGDGSLTMLAVLEALESVDFQLDEALKSYEPWPQVLVNVPVSKKPKFEAIPSFSRAFKEAQVELGDTGRILLRYSGTEPLARVMVEGANARQVRTIAHALAKIIEKKVGRSR